jgi:branched-chain amino acid transport system substrate-binding protein
LFALLAMIGGVLTACGSSSKSSSPSATSAASPATAAASSPSAGAALGTPFVIGFPCTCSGVFASSTAIEAPIVAAWAAWENAHGGVNGHSVKIIKMDDSGSATTALAQVTQMIQQDHVIALIDDSDVDAAWATYVQQQGVPVVGGNLASEAMFTNPDFFPVGETSNVLQQGVVAGEQKAGITKLGIAYCTAVAACALSAGGLKSAASTANINVVYSAKVADAATDYTAPCLAMKQAGADGVSVLSSEAVIESFANSCGAQGYAPKFVETFTSTNNSVVGLAALQGTIEVDPDVPATDMSVPAVQTMNNALNQYQPGTTTSKNWGPGQTDAWAGGMLFAAAAQAASLGTNATSAQLIDGLYSLPHNETLGGLTPPLNYQRGKATTVVCWFYAQIQNHQYTAPFGSAPSCPSSSS